MLDTPMHGWSNIHIGEWSDRCSYLDDVAFMLLHAMIQSCPEHGPVSVKFDAEGWEYIIVFDWCETHIITESGDGFELVTVNIDRDVLARELLADVRRDVVAWAMFPSDDFDEPGIKEREIQLLALCDVLEKSIPSDDRFIKTDLIL